MWWTRKLFRFNRYESCIMPIELKIVIASIATLAAVMSPAVTKARKHSADPLH